MATPLRGKYLVRNFSANALLRCVDGFLSVFNRRAGASNSLRSAPRRILLGNAAHLGDVLIFSAVLPALKSAFPELEIGVVVGAWAKPIVANHPLVKWVHVVDHWKLSRSQESTFRKFCHYLSTRNRALKEIREVRYDTAIDFYYFFPNFIPLLRRARIPTRVGYGSGGFGALLTHEVEWRNRDCHVLDYHKSLLRLLGIAEEHMEYLRPSLPPFDAGLKRRVLSLIGDVDPGPRGYLVLHMGAGQRQKEWPPPKWRELAQRLVASGHRLVFTGAGRGEDAVISTVIDGLDNCINLCGKMSWWEFVSAIANARLLVGLDSVAVHLAAAVGTPCVSIRTGISNPAHWRPLTERCVVLSASVDCSPCYRSAGCEAMDCVRNVPVSFAFDACDRLLNFPCTRC